MKLECKYSEDVLYSEAIRIVLSLEQFRDIPNHPTEIFLMIVKSSKTHENALYEQFRLACLDYYQRLSSGHIKPFWDKY